MNRQPIRTAVNRPLSRPLAADNASADELSSMFGLVRAPSPGLRVCDSPDSPDSPDSAIDAV